MRSTATLVARAAKLEDAEVQRHSRGVVLLPPILNVDTWEAIAMEQQEALAAATREGIDADG